MPSNELETMVKKHESSINNLELAVFGDKNRNIIGMSQKLDDVHTILVQAKGIKGLFGLIVLIGAAVAVFQGWLSPK